jgi:hypothetical protein
LVYWLLVVGELVDWFNGCWLLGIKVKRYKGFLSFVFYFLYFVFCILSWRALCLLCERCEFFEITTENFSGDAEITEF